MSLTVEETLKAKKELEQDFLNKLIDLQVSSGAVVKGVDIDYAPAYSLRGETANVINRVSILLSVE
jgi:hypothetical protein